MLDIPRLDPAKVWKLTWVPRGRDAWAEMYSELSGLTPEDAEVVTVQSGFGTTLDLFLRCGNCGPEVNPLRLVPGISLACPKCYTVYRLEIL